MALDLYVKEDIRGTVLAGIVLAVSLGEGERLAGALIMAQHQALAFNLDWAGIVRDARLQLGAASVLLDTVPMGIIEGGK